MDRKERTIGKEVHLAKTSPHRDRGWQTDYPRVGSGRDLGFANAPREECNPARVWLANNVQVLQDVTGITYPCPPASSSWSPSCGHHKPQLCEPCTILLRIPYPLSDSTLLTAHVTQ